MLILIRVDSFVDDKDLRHKARFMKDFVPGDFGIDPKFQLCEKINNPADAYSYCV
jgi:hypothetical protein